MSGDQGMLYRLAARNEAEAEAQKACAELTDREREVLVLAAKGMEQRRIAESLGLGLSTVQRYWTVALEKLDVNNGMEAAVIATKAGLV